MQRKLHYKSLLFIILFSASVFLSSCTVGNLFHTRYVTFYTKTDSTTVYIQPDDDFDVNKHLNKNNHRLYSDRIKVSVRNRVRDTLTNHITNYNIYQNKAGFLPTLTPIRRTRFNGLKILDYALPGMYLFMLTQMKVNSNDPSYYPLYYYAVLGIWTNLLPGPWSTYQKKFILPALAPIKYRESDENRVYIKSITVDSVNPFQPIEYKTFASYKNHTQEYHGRSYHVYNGDIAKDQAKDSLNHDLRKWGYIDTTSFFSRLYSGACILKCEVQGHGDIYVSKFDMVHIKCLWKLYTPEGDKELYECSVEDTSTWASYRTDVNTDALVRTLNAFLKKPDVIRLLKEKYTEPAEPVKTIDTTAGTVKINTFTPLASDSVKNLQDALEAVVTIKQKDAFFSGCIISPDGYVLTNAHLLNTDVDNADIYVHFANGDSAVATFIKVNSIYDMALYKINKPGHYRSFAPDTSHAIKLGDDIYAIGTAQELNLKQTITKGIVSAKRKIKDKTLIQFDASINRGSSGGALVNKDGKLIGIINTRLIGDNIQGIGFAIPAYYIKEGLGTY